MMTTDAAREGGEEGGSDRQAPTRCMREASQKWTRSSLAVMSIGELMPHAPRGAHRHPYSCAASPASFWSCSATCTRCACASRAALTERQIRSASSVND